VAAYAREPQTADELAIADVPLDLDLDDDYEALYGEPS
jgi:hypothetical protein